MAQLIPVDHDPFDMAASLAAAGGDPLVPPQRNPAMPADWAQNAVRRVGGGLADLLMAPRRAMEHGVTTEEIIPWAGDTAMLMAGAGAPAVVRGAAGRLARTPNQAHIGQLETIASPAVNFRGSVFKAPIHAMANEDVARKFSLSSDDIGRALNSGEYVDGYITSTGRFVSRPEALRLAGDIGHGPDSVGTALGPHIQSRLIPVDHDPFAQ